MRRTVTTMISAAWIEPNESGYGNTTPRLVFMDDAWVWDEQQACIHGLKLRWTCDRCDEDWLRGSDARLHRH